VLSPAWKIKANQRLSTNEWTNIAFNIDQTTKAILSDNPDDFPFVFMYSTLFNKKGIASNCIYQFQRLCVANEIAEIWNRIQKSSFASKDTFQGISRIQKLLYLIEKHPPLSDSLLPVQCLPDFKALMDILHDLSVLQRILKPPSILSFEDSKELAGFCSSIWRKLLSIGFNDKNFKKYRLVLIDRIKSEFAAVIVFHNVTYQQLFGLDSIVENTAVVIANALLEAKQCAVYVKHIDLKAQLETINLGLADESYGFIISELKNKKVNISQNISQNIPPSIPFTHPLPFTNNKEIPKLPMQFI